MEEWYAVEYAWPPINAVVEWMGPNGECCVQRVADFHPAMNIAGYKWRAVKEDAEVLRWRNFYCLV